ncbi:hypothetical protein BRARA_H02247 [Brassica rapa]|uniref:Leucine-rich repeat-containing N-terminal plant-type domain-containing protein n=1 Tax=Brassica campestris TaxID=3711 RepID=A0A397YDR2_BRACM|nr:hypothetical protein BRARA_H02247 [Brassica rapa]
MSGSDMSLRRELAKLRSLCLVICFLYVVTVARVSLRRRLDSSDPRVNTLFSIAEDIGFPRVLAERWRGSDPCQHWYGINCTDGIITTIKLINCNTTGIISLRFAELNSLSLLTKLKKLVILDVSYNDLHGKVIEFRKEVVFAEGNPQIEKDQVISRQSFIWIGIGIGFLLPGVIRVLFYYLVIRKMTSVMET